MVENTKIKNSPPQKLASDLTNRCFPILPKMDLKMEKSVASKLSNASIWDLFKPNYQTQVSIALGQST